MRVTSFLVGAAAGAAAIMYMNKTNKNVMMSFSQLGNNLTNAVDKAMLMVADKNMKTHVEPATGQSLNKVEELANQDPQVRSQVNQILTENHVSAH